MTTEQYPPGPNEPRRPCPHCGADLPPGATFCPSCGRSLRGGGSSWTWLVAAVVAFIAGLAVAFILSSAAGIGAKTVTSTVTAKHGTATTDNNTHVTVSQPTTTVTEPARTVTSPASTVTESTTLTTTTTTTTTSSP